MSENTNKFNDSSVGACWVKKDKNNQNFLSLVIKSGGKEHRFIAFKNKDKGDNVKRPDFRIYPSEARVSSQPATKTVESKPAEVTGQAQSDTEFVL